MNNTIKLSTCMTRLNARTGETGTDVSKRQVALDEILASPYKTDPLKQQCQNAKDSGELAKYGLKGGKRKALSKKSSKKSSKKILKGSNRRKVHSKKSSKTQKR